MMADLGLASGGIYRGLTFQVEMDMLFRYKRVRAVVEVLDQGKEDHRKGKKNAKGQST